MKLRFRQSGGFAGLSRGCEMAVANLAPELRKLLDLAFAQPAVKAASAGVVADATTYALTVDGLGGGKELHFDDCTLPPVFAPLLAHLSDVSKPLPLA